MKNPSFLTLNVVIFCAFHPPGHMEKNYLPDKMGHLYIFPGINRHRCSNLTIFSGKFILTFVNLQQKALAAAI
jgi:hypothetical protein